MPQTCITVFDTKVVIELQFKTLNIALFYRLLSWVSIILLAIGGACKGKRVNYVNYSAVEPKYTPNHALSHTKQKPL